MTQPNPEQQQKQAEGAVINSHVPSLEEGVIPALRRTYLRGFPRRAPQNIAADASTTACDICSKVIEAVRSEYFVIGISRAIKTSSSADLRKVFKSEIDTQAPEIEKSVRMIQKSLLNSLESLRSNPEQLERYHPEKIKDCEALFLKKAPGRIAIREYVDQELAIKNSNLAARVVNEISQAATNAIEMALVARDASPRFSGAARQACVIGSLKYPFLNPQAVSSLAWKTKGHEAMAVIDMLESIHDIPEPQFVKRQSKHTNSLTQRFKANLSAYCADCLRSEDPSQAERIVKFMRDVFSDERVRFYLHYTDGDRALVERIGRALQQGQLTLRIFSCPDYSGSQSMQGDTPIWNYDFRQLGDGVGAVAPRGVQAVQSFLEVFNRHGVQVKIEHYHPSFEVIDGFKSSQSSEFDCGYEQAIAQLQRSAERVKQLYLDQGIDIHTALTRDLVPDLDFRQARSQLAQQIAEDLQTRKDMQELADFIFKNRKALYQSWYPPQSGEDQELYMQRIRKSILPQQMAEYVLFGQMGAGSPDTLMICYDTPLLGEIHVKFGIPVVFAQGSNATDYNGV